MDIFCGTPGNCVIPGEAYNALASDGGSSSDSDLPDLGGAPKCKRVKPLSPFSASEHSSRGEYKTEFSRIC
jgi:hypothetical protein